MADHITVKKRMAIAKKTKIRTSTVATLGRSFVRDVLGRDADARINSLIRADRTMSTLVRESRKQRALKAINKTLVANRKVKKSLRKK